MTCRHESIKHLNLFDLMNFSISVLATTAGELTLMQQFLSNSSYLYPEQVEQKPINWHALSERHIFEKICFWQKPSASLGFFAQQS